MSGVCLLPAARYVRPTSAPPSTKSRVRHGRDRPGPSRFPSRRRRRDPGARAAAADFGGLRALAERPWPRSTRSGIGRGDRVAIVLPNGPEMATAFVADRLRRHHRAAQPGLPGRGVRLLPRPTCSAKALIVGRRRRRPGASRSRGEHGCGVLGWSTSPDRAGRLVRARRAEGGAPARRSRPAPAQADDVALVLHTSGTTSRPKIVPLLAAQPRGLGAPHRRDAGADAGRPLPQHHAAVPHPRPDRGGARPRCRPAASIFCTPGFNALRFFALARRGAADLVHGRADHAPGDPGRAPSATRRSSPRAKLRFIRSSSASLPPQVMQELEETFGCAGDRELRHDRGRATRWPRNPLPPRARKPGSVGIAAGPRGRASWTRTAQLLPAGRDGRGRDPRPQRDAGLRGQPRGQRQGVFTRRLVPHRRPGRARRRGLSAPHRPAEGDHQPRRREGQPARGRRGADGPPGRGAGRSPSPCRTTSWARRSPPRWCCARAWR